MTDLQNEEDKKKKENEEKMERIHHYFQRYRNNGIVFSATLITLSSGLIIWAQQLKDSSACKITIINVQTIILALSIGSCISIHYFHYIGYKKFALMHTNQSNQAESDKQFDNMDKAVDRSLFWFFIPGVIISFVIKFLL